MNDELPLIGVTPAISSGADQVASHLLQKAGSVATCRRSPRYGEVGHPEIFITWELSNLRYSPLVSQY
jgi:hypothetical protein